MTTKSVSLGLTAVPAFLEMLFRVAAFVASPVIAQITKVKERKLILRTASPSRAYTEFSGYKESEITSRAVIDSRGRVLAQVKLWLYLDTRTVYREVTFLNPLLRASVGLSRVPFAPIQMGVGDTPATMMEVSVRDFESWLRKRTAGTQFGIECARNAAAKPADARVVSTMPPVASVAAPQAASVVKATPPAQPVKPPVAAPAVKPAAPVAPKSPRPRAKVEEEVCGIVVKFGVEPRTIGTRPSFDQYCVDLELIDKPNEGKLHRVWGTDLERGIVESRAKIGDKVAIQSHGSLPTSNPTGGRSQKNCFTILVLP
ncbi:hypothetical protein [Polaromonas sp. JS666]|uniref:hypothetical protein n=1 Tax=Polaromonas sp. (strain JS666 / ATCC BAA-500) TaxID=296591 RepID=UPI0000537CBA|nr:hypothetical protein [Polaromonas sp. JS666]ABE47354.1 hypothetical protein Bpro_5500 [Polaromonas sp. JS666]